VLTSLWLLEQLYRDGSQARSVKVKSPDNQYLKECASVSEAQSRTEKKSSMDEGSSMMTSPVDIQSVQAYDELCETGLGMSTKPKYFDKKEVNHGNYSLPHVSEDLNEVRPFVQEELDETSGGESFEEPYETPKSSNSYVKIKTVEHQR
ncbi:CPLN1 protein, partial [Podilymbus podiceps]|nr:CPLN1 protein [Podilymbus podiceps]